MCGIAGIIPPDKQDVSRERLQGLASALAHRGPDAEGFWQAPGVALAHRRLSIIDLNPTGAQPMKYRHLTMVFNGEIYNYQSLKADLEKEGEVFASQSDTEVILHLYAKEGRECLQKLHGMFAFAIWDAEREELFFARDRVGKKPFYYRLEEGEFSFASEVSALTQDRAAGVDWMSIRRFLGLQYIPSPWTGYQGIAHLPPGMYGTFKAGKIEIGRYYAFSYEPTLEMGYGQATQTVRELLREAVRLRLIADVEVGAFLSGGMDSSAVVALMHELKGEGVQTFTMGFPSMGLDERAEAAWLAKRLGTRHYAFEAKPEDAVSLLDRLVGQYGVPYADASALPTWLLAEQTSKQVKVVLTGDGGDEVFGGYRRYRAFLRAQSLARWGLAWPAAFGASSAAKLLRDPRFERFAHVLRGLQDNEGKGYAALFSGAYFDAEAEARLLLPEFREQTEDKTAEAFIEAHYHAQRGVGAMQDFDFHSYLPDDLNVKMDRATMAHGLEARSPFLDQDLVQFVMHLPAAWHFHSKQQKPLLAAALQGLVPDEVLKRRKRGFQVPLGEWFRTSLREPFRERCLRDGAALQAICRREELERYLDENDRGLDHGNRLWMLLTLATWLERTQSAL